MLEHDFFIDNSYLLKYEDQSNLLLLLVDSA